jgi:hypothetical protein
MWLSQLLQNGRPLDWINMCNSLLELEVSVKCLKNTMLLSRKNQITASPYNSRLFCVVLLMTCLKTKYYVQAITSHLPSGNQNIHLSYTCLSDLLFVYLKTPDILHTWHWITINQSINQSISQIRQILPRLFMFMIEKNKRGRCCNMY